MSAHDHADDGQHFAHPMPIPMLLAVFVALTILTIITVAQTNFDFGAFDVLIVMVIATIKATLVGAFFMHLAWDKPYNILLFIGSFVFVGIFVIFTMSDSQMTAGDFIQVDDAPPPAAIATAE